MAAFDKRARAVKGKQLHCGPLTEPILKYTNTSKGTSVLASARVKGLTSLV